MIKNKRINISLPSSTLTKLKNQIPDGKRSEFIAKVLEEKLEQRRSLKADIIRDLKENRWIDEQVYKEWEGTESPWPEY